MTGWTIAAAELRIPRRTSFAAHKMVIVVDPDGQAVRQLNGLASWYDKASGRWRHKPIGYLSSDRLRAYDTDTHPQTFLPMNGVAPRSRDVRAAMANGDVVRLSEPVSGMDADELQSAIFPAVSAIERINALSPGPHGGGGVRYPFLGLGANSNSVFATLVEAMGFAPPKFARPARLTPGVASLLLGAQEIASLRRDPKRDVPLNV